MNIAKLGAIYLGDITHLNEETTLAHIERCGRTCYQSEKAGDPIRFIQRLIKSGHTSVLEHSQIVISVPMELRSEFLASLTETGRYRFFDLDMLGQGFLAGNLRSWLDLYKDKDRIISHTHDQLFGPVKAALPNLLDSWDILPMNEGLVCGSDVPVKLRRHAAYITANRGVLAEFTRHRMSYSVESSRYCNYSDEKYDRSVSFTGWEHVGGVKCRDSSDSSLAASIWYEACRVSEEAYLRLCKVTTPDFARSVLNMSLRTRWHVSGIPLYWTNFFYLRDDLAAHYDIRHIAQLLKPKMIEFL